MLFCSAVTPFPSTLRQVYLEKAGSAGGGTPVLAAARFRSSAPGGVGYWQQALLPSLGAQSGNRARNEGGNNVDVYI